MDEHKGSMFNQKYFEGFRKLITMKEDGCLGVEFVYQGQYYLPEQPAKRLHPATELCITLVLASALIGMMASSAAINHQKLSTLLQAGCLLLYILLAACVCVRPASTERMTLWTYRMGIMSVKEILLVQLLLTSGLTLCAGAALFVEHGPALADLFCLLGYAGSACVQFLFLRRAMHERFVTEESPDQPKGIDVTPDLTPGGTDRKF